MTMAMVLIAVTVVTVGLGLVMLKFIWEDEPGESVEPSITTGHLATG